MCEALEPQVVKGTDHYLQFMLFELAWEHLHVIPISLSSKMCSITANTKDTHASRSKERDNKQEIPGNLTPQLF